jgi:hypothetical protein
VLRHQLAISQFDTFGRSTPRNGIEGFKQDAFFWALQGIRALHRKPFSIELGHQQLAAPYTVDSFTRAAHAYGFDATLGKCKVDKLHKESFPSSAWAWWSPRYSRLACNNNSSSAHASAFSFVLQFKGFRKCHP